MCKNKTALAFGYFLALVHLVWALAVWIIPSQLQKMLDWCFALHGLESYMIITSMNLLNLILLVIVTFIAGYIIGWVLAWLLECCNKEKAKKKK